MDSKNELARIAQTTWSIVRVKDGKVLSSFSKRDMDLAYSLFIKLMPKDYLYLPPGGKTWTSFESASHPFLDISVSSN